MLRVDCKEKAEMKSALLTADWQFQRPTEKERGVVEDVAIGRRFQFQYVNLVVKINVQRGFYKGCSPKKLVLEKFVGISAYCDPEPQNSLRSLGYICSNSQKYIVWVKIIEEIYKIPLHNVLMISGIQ